MVSFSPSTLGIYHIKFCSFYCMSKQLIVLISKQMGSMDGCKATRVIRRLEAEAETGQSIPIIAFTALVTADNERECFNSGMDTFLNKPAQEHLLAAAIVETIARKSHKFSCDEQAEAQDEK